MTSIQREASQIPRSGAYVVTAITNSNFVGFTEAGASATVAASVGTILYDMGKTVRVTNGGVNYVLRKVQKAVAGGTATASDVIYISIGSASNNSTADAVAASAVARL